MNSAKGSEGTKIKTNEYVISELTQVLYAGVKMVG